MGLKTTEVVISLGGNNSRYYKNKGYEIPKSKNNGRITTKRGTTILVKVDDLPYNSNVKVNVQCDKCGKELKNLTWCSYNRSVRENGIYYCVKCAQELFAAENIILTRLKNGKSFEQWCVENNRQNVLYFWDYELNDCKPSEINYGTQKKYYFKCPKGLHSSELKSINNFTNDENGVVGCRQCNSFAQWGIDNICENFLEKYWDYEKNTVNPWNISYGSKQKVFIKCQTPKCFNCYPVECKCFTLKNSRCPECNQTKGETVINNYLLNNCWEKILNKYFEKLDINNKFINNYYITQKKFKGLIGINDGLLSYDFYLPKINLLIEFQGQQHEKFNKLFHKSYKDFEKQLEHDRRKREYAKNNNINLLEIWYYDLNNIEEILDKYLIEKGGSLNRNYI